MNSRFTFTTFGSIDACRTEVELSRDGAVCAVVYETEVGWQTKYIGATEITSSDAELAVAIEEARQHLTHYVNRRGIDSPRGLTRAGLSLWLLEKDDGTSMGTPISR